MAMKAKLENCVFYRTKCPAKLVEIMASNVVFQFVAAIERQGIQQKCTQTFKTYGDFKSFSIASRNSIGSTLTDQPASSAPTTLAVCSPVVEIQRLGKNLSRVDCQTLAIYFALKYAAQSASAQTPYAKIISSKMSAVQALQAPGAQWRELLAKHAALNVVPPGHPCECKCGCHCVSGCVTHCHRCNTRCCQKCIPKRRSLKELGGVFDRLCVCHSCTRSSKLDVPLWPLDPMDGFGWYFNYPCDVRRVPDVLYNPNRNTNFDPPLIEVIMVSKRVYLENDMRHVRPTNWETVFEVVVAVEDTAGQPQRVCMNLFCFVMNPQWRRDPIVKFLESWLPTNLGYVGVVRDTDRMYTHRAKSPERPSPPSPPSPCPYGSPEEAATPGVTFEEVDDSTEPDTNSLLYLLQLPGVTYEEFEAAGFGSHSVALKLKDNALRAAERDCPDAKRRREQ
jgi:hypothetical protein